LESQHAHSKSVGSLLYIMSTETKRLHLVPIFGVNPLDSEQGRC
jgi:hypothetical protein